jgi:hypothetical protein
MSTICMKLDPGMNIGMHLVSFLKPGVTRRLLVLGQRGDRDKVGSRNIFPLGKYLKSSTLAPSCDPARFVKSPMRGYTMHR